MNKKTMIDYLRNIPKEDWGTVSMERGEHVRGSNGALGEVVTVTIELVDVVEKFVEDIFVSYKYDHGVGNRVMRIKYPECDSDVEQIEKSIRDTHNFEWVVINNFKRL